MSPWISSVLKLLPQHLDLYELLLLMLMAFGAGSVPFALWISKARGIDIREHGSGNLGATNVWRVLGPGPGLLCFTLDLAKGFLPTLYAGLYLEAVPGLLFARPIEPAINAWWWLIIMALPILGHMYSPWVKFQGGKGVATGLGALLGVFPYLTVPAAGGALVWAIGALVTRYVSVASLVAAVSLPLLVVGWAWISVNATGIAQSKPKLTEAMVLQGPGLIPLYIVTGVLAAIVVWKHRSNMRRLLTGRESRIGSRVNWRSRARARLVARREVRLPTPRRGRAIE